MAGPAGAGQAKAITVGEVVRTALPNFSQTHRLPARHWKVLRASAACHTPALGGHQYQCAHCGQEHFVPHSCGNRHCPSCQKLNAAQWLERQLETLLPIPYFHVVFTLPHLLNPLIQHNQASLYRLLFASATAIRLLKAQKASFFPGALDSHLLSPPTLSSPLTRVTEPRFPGDEAADRIIEASGRPCPANHDILDLPAWGERGRPTDSHPQLAVAAIQGDRVARSDSATVPFSE